MSPVKANRKKNSGDRADGCRKRHSTQHTRKVQQKFAATSILHVPFASRGLSDLSGFVRLEQPGEVLFVRRFFFYHLRRHRQMPRTAMTPRLQPLLDSVRAAAKSKNWLAALALALTLPHICAPFTLPACFAVFNQRTLVRQISPS